jgi:cysteine sulfinate desulfinase/cysteine desulfurase-like protein
MRNQGVLENYDSGHLVISNVEHDAVVEVAKYLESKGFSYSAVPVDAFGAVNVRDVEEALRPDTRIVSIMHANNEVASTSAPPSPTDWNHAADRRHWTPLPTERSSTPL